MSDRALEPLRQAEMAHRNDYGYGVDESRPPRQGEDFDGGSVTVKELLGRAVGAASSCWEHRDRAGVFDSTRASEVLTIMLGHLARMGLPEDTRLDAGLRVYPRFAAASGGPTGRPAGSQQTD